MDAHLRRLLSEPLADPQRSGLSGLLGETLVEIVWSRDAEI